MTASKTARGEIDLLYIHPHGQLRDDAIVPVGAVTCGNEYRGPKAGVLSRELNEELLAKARVVAVDLFWASACEPFLSIVKWIKKKRPGLPVIAGGYTAAMFPRMLKKEAGVDHVLTGVNCEEDFCRLVSAAAGRRGAGAGRGAGVDPAPREWLSAGVSRGTLDIHLKRDCNNRMGPCCPCVIGRSRGSGAPLYTPGRLRKLIGGAEGNVAIWAGGSGAREIAALLKLLKGIPRRPPVLLTTCGELPPDTAALLKKISGAPVTLVHVVFWNPLGQLPAAQRETQKRVMAELLPLGNVKLFSQTVYDDPGAVLDERTSHLLPRPLNWNFPVFSDDARGLKLARDLSAAANRILPLRDLCPSLFRLTQIGADPQCVPPEALPGIGRALAASMRKGLSRWGTILPVEFPVSAILVGPRARSGLRFDGSLVHRSSVELKPGPRLPVAAEVTHTGWRLRVDTSSLRRGNGAGGAGGLIIVPDAFRSALSQASSWPIRAFPLAAGRPPARYDIEIAGAAVRWPGSGWVEMRG